MCAVCVSTICVCIYIHTHVYICKPIHVCSYVHMDLSHRSEMLEFPSPWKPESCHIALSLLKLDKLKLSGFIRKKLILQSHTVSVISSSSLLNKLCSHECSLTSHHSEKGMMGGCLIEVTLKGVVIFFNLLRIIDKKIHSYFVFSESWVYLIMLTRIIYGNY